MLKALQALPRKREERGQTLGDFRFAHLLGAKVWARLPLSVRKRFGKRLGPGASVVYRGEVIETRLSLLGRIFAQILRPVGAPLPLEQSKGGEAAIVTVTEAPNGQGQFWTRQYNRKAGFPQVIHSQKSFTGPTGLEEQVGGGIGMTLRLKAEPKSLLFVSDEYFINLFGTRIYFPRWLTPGALTVGHHDLGNGRFDFTLDLVHPLFGHLLHQRARFIDMKDTIK